MDNFKISLNEAINAFRTADHLAYVSYPLLKDKRLLLAIVQNLYLAGAKCMEALLRYERLYKRISVIPEDFNSRLSIIEKDLAKNANIGIKTLNSIRELDFLSKHHRDSPTEFYRRDKLVICSEGFADIRTVDIELLKEHTSNLRKFLEVLKRLK